VPHAGESSGPQSMWDALDFLGAERIGHGIAAAQDPALLRALIDRGIALEICPTSNVCTRSVPSLSEHPLPALVEAGVVVTINSDDPPMFATTLNDEYVVAADVLGLEVSGVADLARTAARVSFMPDSDRATLIAEIDGYEGSWVSGGTRA
jgi:adenosine deaminase